MEPTSTVGEYLDNALVLPARLSFEKWTQVGQALQAMRRSGLWWLGDWLAYGETKYGEKYAQAIDISGLDRETLRAAQWVSSRFPQLERRRPTLSWSHHKEVTALLPREADKLLQVAESEGWPVMRLRAEVTRRKAAKKDAVKLLPAPPTIENEEVADSCRNGSDLPQGPRGLLEYHRFITDTQDRLAEQFPDADPAVTLDIATWWWDALAHYELVPPSPIAEEAA